MRSSIYLLVFTVFSVAASKYATAAPTHRVILVGDSTMAPRSGYGDALCARFRPDVDCVNLAKGGRSSKSYRAEGSWTTVQLLLMKRPTDLQYVLIQFGHNDQPGKGERSTTLSEYSANLGRYVDEVRRAGAQPILISPLTRRQFSRGKVIRNLEEWAQAARAVAAAEKVPLLDLYRDSVQAVERMGSPDANTLAQAPPPAVVTAASLTGTTVEAPKREQADPVAPVFDYTHLGKKGAQFFATMVSRELKAAAPELGSLLRGSK
ncbi:MAG TPA: rhamnogalacturonan acetylesterase [Steroidobacteraceae bacterium]|nr:rhamnogalacturonan acetylesterase [Steroidobacteraceae bacterium]